MQSSVRNGERCSTVKAYLRPVMNRPNLHISINTMATKVTKILPIDFIFFDKIIKIKIKMEMGNVSKRQQPDQRADDSQSKPIGFQCKHAAWFNMYFDISTLPLYL